MTLKEWLLAILPPWLQGPQAKALIGTLAATADSVRDDGAFGAKETMIEECTTDAYPAHLRNSSLTVVPGEAPATTLGVLRGRWLQHRQSGSVDGVTAALERLGCTGVQVQSQLDLVIAGAPGTPFGGIGGYFFVIVHIPGISTAAPVWKGGQVWQQNPAAMPPIPPTYWDSDSEAASLLTLAVIHEIQKFKPAVCSLRFLVVPRDGTFTYDPTSNTPFTGAYVIVPVWEQWERQITANRLPNEFYNFSYLVQ